MISESGRIFIPYKAGSRKNKSSFATKTFFLFKAVELFLTIQTAPNTLSTQVEELIVHLSCAFLTKKGALLLPLDELGLLTVNS